MSKIAEVKTYNSDKNGEWMLENEYKYELINEDLRQMQAEIYKTEGMADFKIIGQDELTYAEIEDLTELTNIISEFYDVCAAAIVKNSTPASVALAPDIQNAYDKVLDSDPTALFGAAIGFSVKIDCEIAKQLILLPIRLVMAPEIEKSAVEILKSNPLIKVLVLNTSFENFSKLTQKEIRVTPFGTVCKDVNRRSLDKNSFNVVTKIKPTKEQIEDAVFVWKISKYTHSNSIVVAKDFKTLAVSQGFTSVAGAVEAAMDTSCDGAKDSVMASDTVLDTEECIYAAVQGRISTIIQPGGSKNDSKLIELANKYNISMIFTGINNYKL